jgi:hypothetical protein
MIRSCLAVLRRVGRAIAAIGRKRAHCDCCGEKLSPPATYLCDRCWEGTAI